ncbi:uncharacterized protein LOC117105487 isoform X3 [Anneissia japonica]|uniref:uncharacterized protein LOC117105487 isoform X3 n=1 Tax=Anneissia japonica TaxID=1529436 RepID=UPI001425A4C5|nr:uncharacterized protein LOC117105487 isoform X3 [Anneissia japonica]
MQMDSDNNSGEEAVDAQTQSASMQPTSPQPDVSQSTSLQSDIPEPENPAPDSPGLGSLGPDSGLQQQDPPGQTPEIDKESHSPTGSESIKAHKQNEKESENHEVIGQKINERELRVVKDDVDAEGKGTASTNIDTDEEVGEEGVEKMEKQDMNDEKGDGSQQELKVSDMAVDEVNTNMDMKSNKRETPTKKTTEIKPLPVDNKKTTHKQKNNKSKRSVFNRSHSPSMCSPEYAIDTMVVEEYEEASRLLKETNSRLATDVELARQHSQKLSHAFNKRIKAAQERIEDLERELQMTFDTAVHFETLYEKMKLEEGTSKSSHSAPHRAQTPTTIMIQPKEIDVKYLSLVEENKCLKEEMRRLKDENKLLKMRTNESFIDVQHHKWRIQEFKNRGGPGRNLHR